jgi:hypothetical protein
MNARLLVSSRELLRPQVEHVARKDPLHREVHPRLWISYRIYFLQNLWQQLERFLSFVPFYLPPGIREAGVV